MNNIVSSCRDLKSGEQVVVTTKWQDAILYALLGALEIGIGPLAIHSERITGNAQIQ